MHNSGSYIIILLLLSGLIACDGLFNNDPDNPDIDNPDEAPVLTCEDFTEDIDLEDDPDREVDYIIDCLVDVSDIEIRIIDGAIIEFTEGSGFIFNGDARVVFYSATEDPVIFRGNQPEKGFWKGIHVASDQNSNLISHIEVHHAGSKDDNRFFGAIQVSGTVRIGRALINESANYGLYYENEIGDFQNDFINSEITNCDNYPVRIPIHLLSDLGGDDNNSYSNNKPNRIKVIGNELNRSLIIGKQLIPYEFGETLIANASMNFEDDVHCIFKENTRLIINNSISAWDDGGDPILFTAENKVAGGWNGIYINTGQTGTTLHFENVVIEYGGGGSDMAANLAIESGRVRVEDCEIRYSQDCGIKYITSQSTLFDTNNNFINNAGGGVCEIN